MLLVMLLMKTYLRSIMLTGRNIHGESKVCITSQSMRDHITCLLPDIGYHIYSTLLITQGPF